MNTRGRTANWLQHSGLFLAFVWLVPAVRADISEAEAKVAAIAFIGRKVELSLVGQGSQSNAEGKGKKCFIFAVPKEGIEMKVDANSGLICNYIWFKWYQAATKTVLPRERALALALNFLKKRAKPTTESLSAPSISLNERGENEKHYRFHWVKKVGDLIYPSAIFLTLNAETGEVIDYQWIENEVTLESLTPKLSREQAIEAATPFVELLPGWKVESVRRSIIPGPPQQMWWQIVARGSAIVEDSPEGGQFAQESVATVSIEADTGKKVFSLVGEVKSAKRIQLRAPAVMPYGLNSQDYWPSWTPEQKTLVVSTFRWLDLGSAEANARVRRETQEGKPLPHGQVLGIQRDGEFRGLMTFEGKLDFPSVNADGSRIAFTYGLGGVYVLDLAKGVLGKCNNTRARRTMPNWHPTESWLAMSGTHSPSDGVGSEDDDILVAQISKNLGAAPVERQWCAAHMPGKDVLPVFSPDGKWIVFAHQEPVTIKNLNPGWTLFRVRSDGSSQSAPDKIVDLVDEVERLSWTPDSKEVLVAYKKPPVASANYEQNQPKIPFEMIGVEEKTRRTLTFPTLHDPDLPNGKPLFMKVAALSPDGKTISFSALRWSGSAKDVGAVCVYTVKLDGSDLKRITSPEDISIPSFAYPQKDVTALNAFEKLLAQPNLGRR